MADPIRTPDPRLDPVSPVPPLGADPLAPRAPGTVDNRTVVRSSNSNGILIAAVILVLAVIAYFVFAPATTEAPVTEPAATTTTEPAATTTTTEPAGTATGEAPATATPAPAPAATETAPAATETAPAAPAAEPAPAAPATEGTAPATDGTAPAAGGTTAPAQ